VIGDFISQPAEETVSCQEVVSVARAVREQDCYFE